MIQLGRRWEVFQVRNANEVVCFCYLRILSAGEIASPNFRTKYSIATPGEVLTTWLNHHRVTSHEGDGYL